MSTKKNYAVIPKASCQPFVSSRVPSGYGRALFRKWEAREGFKGWKQEV